MTDRPPTRASSKGAGLRDHLANERTLLAWVRTALAFMAFGVAVKKFSMFMHYNALQAGAADPTNPSWSQWVGIILVALGGAMAAGGAYRTRRWARHAGAAPGAPNDRLLMAVALSTVCISILLMAYLATS